MNWYIGQEVVCVRTHPDKVVVRGKTYPIKGLKQSACRCKNINIDVGIRANHAIYSEYSRCNVCNDVELVGDIFWLHENRFAPLDQDISELTAILEEVVKV